MNDEMEMMNGTCRYCGQVIAVKAMDQIDANLKAEDECNCDRAVRAKKFKAAGTYLQTLICGDRCREAGFAELTDKQVRLASLALESICKDNVLSVQINLEDSTLKLSAKAEDKVSIIRGKKISMRTEA